MNKIKYYFKTHRIQNKQAIISLVMRNEIPLLEDGCQFLEWGGDAYELRKELNKQIESLEKKYNHISS